MTFRDDTYGAQYRQLRLTVSNRDDARCVVCDHDGSTSPLHTHHRCYRGGNAPLLRDLYLLCARCHEGVHDFMRRERYQTAGTPTPVATKQLHSPPQIGYSDRQVSPVARASVVSARPGFIYREK